MKRHQLTTKASGLPEGLSWGMAGERITFSFYDSSESKIRTLTLNLSLEAQLQEIGMFPARSKVKAVREFFLLETLDSPSVYFFKPRSPCQLVGSDYSYKDQRPKVTLDTGKSKITAVQYLLNQKMMTEPIPPDRTFRRSLIFPFIPAVDHYLHLRLICGEVERRYHIAIPLFTGLPKPDFYELNPRGLNRFLYGPTSITSKENKSDILYYRFSELSKEERAYKKRGKFVIKAPQYADVNDLILRLYDKEKGIFSQEARFKLQYFQKGSIQERLDYIDTELDTRKDSANKLRELDKQIEKLEKELN